MNNQDKIRHTLDTAIKSLYQMLIIVNEDTGECEMIDHNRELDNISQDVHSFDQFCQELYVNIHPEDREDFLHFTDAGGFPKAIKNKVFTSFECRLRHVNKRYYWSEITFCNGTEEDHSVGHDHLFLIRDIHEWKKKELNQEAEQRAVLKTLQNKYDALFEENMIDQQTGCYNRKGMKYYTDIILDKARSAGDYLFVCVADLNGLKHLNDTYGHAAGDKAIAVVSRELLKAAPQGSRIVRIGGDEFLLMASLPEDSREPEEMGGKIDAALQDYSAHQEHPYEVGVSYGWVLMPLKEGMMDLDEYIEMADARMYEMKTQRDEFRR